MSKPTLLITGISGFIGQALTTALHEDYKIYGFYEHIDKMEKNSEVPLTRKYHVDLRNRALVEYLVRMIQPDYVIHLAARSEVANSFDNYEEVADINYKGTVLLAEACRKHVPEFKLFVMASTMETYGHQPEVPFTEETIQYPMAPYAVAKVASENYLRYMEYAYGFPATILRQTNTYGRTDNNFFVVERIISQFFTDFWTINLGEPDPKRNFLHISDLVELYKSVLSKVEVARGQTFVTGPNNAVTIKELADMIAEMCGYADRDGIFEWHTIPKRPGEIYYLNSDPKKAKDLLGWEPKVSLREGLQMTIDQFEEREMARFNRNLATGPHEVI